MLLYSVEAKNNLKDTLIAARSNSLFATLCVEDLEALYQAGLRQAHTHGSVIFRAGDEGDGLYLIEEGEVRITAELGDSNSRNLAVVQAGDFFGEMAVLDCESRSANAVAVGETKLLFLPRDAVLAFLERSPRAALNLVREFSRRMREFNKKFVEEMLQADRMALVGKFAGSIVHDFKNPLGIVRMSAEMGTMPDVPQAMRDSARARINKQIDRLSSMIGELLEFSRGPKKAELAPLNFTEFILPLIADLRAESSQKKVVVEMENEPPPIEIGIDEKRLPNVFYNLVHNAVDAMKPAGGKVIFRFSTTEEMLGVEVEDTGKGIPPQVLAKLFEPFATFGKAGGTGLGLSICKRIVVDHGGAIEARNEAGRGAVFRIDLPIWTPTRVTQTGN